MNAWIFWLYVVPITPILVMVVLNLIRDFKHEIENSKMSWFIPTITVGNILVRLLIPFIPVINFIAFLLICYGFLDMNVIKHKPKV
jgi:tellurite resistance protein TehA-like permease